ncbi:MAG TPA: glycosyltransferase [Longimicrobiaceae bacterium]|nr:glycosyltransferase [Longimicrobiaceae bacterium]
MISPVERPIRVAFCIDNMNLGGTELNAVRTAERLDRSRFELRVFCLQGEGPLLERYAAAGVPVHSLPIPNLYGPGAWRQGRRLARLLREYRIDVLHAHDVYSNVFAVPWARRAGVGTIASRRWWEGLPGLHWKLASAAAHRVAHRTLANAPGVARLLEREGIARDRIAVVPNFLDESAFELLPEAERPERLGALGADPGARQVGVVANLHPVKDHASLVKAVSLLAGRYPDLQLVLVGDGSMREPLETLAAERGIRERVVFAGRRANAASLHQLFEVSVLPSYSEGFPNTILEAMAAARPVVATTVGAIPDAVVDGETGLLVPPRDPDRLAAALDTLLSDPARARRMGEAGRERAREHFSARAALSRLEGLYRELAGARVDG